MGRGEVAATGHFRLTPMTDGRGDTERGVVAPAGLDALIAERYAQGCCPAQIFGALTSGALGAEAAAPLGPQAAVAALQRALGAALSSRETDALLRGCPGPDFGRLPSAIDVPGRRVGVLMKIERPPIVLFDGLIDADECEEVMRLATPRLAPSTHNYDGRPLSESRDDGRTSESADLLRSERLEVCERLDRRVEALLNWPAEFSAKWQVLRYGVGAQFRPHYDCFGAQFGPWHPVFRAGGARCGTLIIFLATPRRGGATSFPQLSLEVPALRGNALYFGYPRPVRVLHSGTPVLEGEKWVMVKWFRLGPFARA